MTLWILWFDRELIVANSRLYFLLKSPGMIFYTTGFVLKKPLTSFRENKVDSLSNRVKQPIEDILEFAKKKLWEEINIPTGDDLLDEAVKIQSFGIVRDILQGNFDAALRKACLGNFPKIAAMLIPKVKNIDSISLNANERTALHFASFNGMTQTVKLLLDNGANVNAADKHTITPIGLAKDTATRNLLHESGGMIYCHYKNAHMQFYANEDYNVVVPNPIPLELMWLEKLENIKLISEKGQFRGFGGKKPVISDECWNPVQMKEILSVTTTHKMTAAEFYQHFQKHPTNYAFIRINNILSSEDSFKNKGQLIQLTTTQLEYVIELALKKEKLEDSLNTKFSVMMREVDSVNCVFKSAVKVDQSLKDKLHNMDDRLYKINNEMLIIESQNVEELTRLLSNTASYRQ
jgi:hypothetical protein